MAWEAEVTRTLDEYLHAVNASMAEPRAPGGPVAAGGAPISVDFKPQTAEVAAALAAPMTGAGIYGPDPLAGLPKAAPNIVNGNVDYGADPLAKPYSPPPSPTPPVGPAAAATDANPNELTIRRVSGGGMTAPREVDLRGPSLTRAQDRANLAAEGAVGSIEQRSDAASAFEYGQALDMERQARAREAAMDASAAEREAELANMHQDFAASSKALGKMSLDPNRFWASRTTGQKVATFIGLAFGGFLQGARGGTNPAMDALNTQIDRDIKAQEFAYGAQKDATQGKMTAFALAMQKYNNADAARAMARVSALDGIQAQIAQTAALWKGTEAGNRADAALAQIEQVKMEQIAQGVRFLPSQLAPRMYEDPRYPGFYHNTHAFFQRAITTMPWYQDLELERHGARYLEPELNVVLLTSDGRALQWWTDFERTAQSFATFSRRDAETLRRWHDEFAPILGEIRAVDAFSPPRPPDERRALLGRTDRGRRLLEVAELSPLEFVEREFEHPTIKAGLLFFNGLREVDLRAHGFGHSK